MCPLSPQSPMSLAVNYSPQAADLARRGLVQVDLFKCPPWPDLVAEASRGLPVFVHFDFQAGQGEPESSDITAAEILLSETSTSFVNTHLAPLARDPAAAEDTKSTRVIREESRNRVRGRATADLRRLTQHFGADRVLLENVPWERRSGYPLDPLAADPELFSAIAAACDCRFLLDLAHARFAAEELGLPTRTYIEALPLNRLSELHVTGLGFDPEGRRRDHMSMDAEAWRILEWALENIAADAWPRPWVIALEYGGVGPIFEWRSRSEVLRRELGSLRRRLDRMRL